MGSSPSTAALVDALVAGSTIGSSCDRELGARIMLEAELISSCSSRGPCPKSRVSSSGGDSFTSTSEFMVVYEYWYYRGTIHNNHI